MKLDEALKISEVRTILDHGRITYWIDCRARLVLGDVVYTAYMDKTIDIRGKDDGLSHWPANCIDLGVKDNQNWEPLGRNET